MAFNGEVKRVAQVTNDSPQLFYDDLRYQIGLFDDLHIEFHYDTATSLNGKILHSVLLVGREREAE